MTITAEEPRVSTKATLAISAAIIFAGAVFTVVIFSTEPEAQREAATRKTAMPVEVIAAEAGDYRPLISAMGTVTPARQVTLRPRISGQVIAVSENFVPGGRVSQGEVLVQVDPADYQNQLRQRRSELTQARTALEIEMGEQAIARGDYEQLDRKLSDMQRALVLREPQLNAAKAIMEAAEANVAQAELELERTRIKAPFDAQVLSQLVNVGSEIAPGTDLAELIGLSTYWVEATVPLAKLRWIGVADTSTNVQVRNRTAWPADEYRQGRVHSIIGELEGQTRMARVLIAVDDPLATEVENHGKMPLMAGTFVECRIQANTLRDVVRIEREYVRKNNTAWVMEDGLLAIRPLEIVFQDEHYAYVEKGLEAGDRVVITSLSRVSDGAELRLAGVNADG